MNISKTAPPLTAKRCVDKVGIWDLGFGICAKTRSRINFAALVVPLEPLLKIAKPTAVREEACSKGWDLEFGIWDLRENALQDSR